MKTTFSIFKERFYPVSLAAIIIIAISFLTRAMLLFKSGSGFDWSLFNLIGVFGIGLLFDLAMISYFIIPLVLFVWLTPDKWYRKSGNRLILYGYFLLVTFLGIFNAVSEWFFWDEFSTRYNFIAVDYLVYTTEVVGNIWQSYPIVKLLIGIFVISILVLWRIKGKIKKSIESSYRFQSRSIVAIFLLLLPIITFYGISNKWKKFSQNEYANELAGNGLFDFGSAFWNNELDYNSFYQTLPQAEVVKTLRILLKEKNSQFLDNAVGIERQISPNEPEKKLNVVLISVESLSASFLAHFGNTDGVTPQLDSLADQGILFTQLYASGTRTVRGLESLSLAIPPTPGQSIVKRPENEGLFSLGSVFRSKGYATQFIYGGYSYFDNMGYFFANNGYEAIDRDSLKKEEIHYENIWGVADEDLFTLSLRELDKNYRNGKPFFSHIMTVSNHRPYTYPEGRIDIPSHSSRSGAVKYSDYAIGKFIREAKTKPWFDHTIFVIVADHCASSAGKVELPVDKYHIPMIIYSPKNIAPQRFERLTAQIDIPPTILGLLNFNYRSKFFGYDIFRLEEGRERVFISTYQSLGYIRNKQLVILQPNRKVTAFTPDFTTGDAQSAPLNEQLQKEAISYYQHAAYLYRNHLYNKTK
ncbi:MAG: LTA synthase family protein [Sphingobacteriaceae bacterium]